VRVAGEYKINFNAAYTVMGDLQKHRHSRPQQSRTNLQLNGS
jgi:hypothetical protein